MGIIRAANTSELNAALRRATGGDTILLTGQDYGSVTVSRIKPTGSVLIKSDDVGTKATFRSLNISESANLAFDDINVQFTPLATTNNLDPLVRIFKSDDIRLTNSSLRGYLATTGVPFEATALDASRNVIGLPVGRGIWVDQSTDIRLSSNDLSVLSRGIGLANSTDLVVSNNNIHDLRTTGIQAGGISNALISGNHIHSSTPWSFGGAGDHGDYIHIWSTGTERGANANVKITGNLLEEGTGTSMLGIYLDDNNSGVGFTGYEISHNVLLLGEHQAIRLENVEGVVANNTLLQTSGSDKETPLVIATDDSDVSIINNIFSGVSVYNGAFATQSNNMIVQGWTRGASHYDSVFNFDASDGVTIEDLTPRAAFTSGLTGVGANLLYFDKWNSESPMLEMPAVANALSDALSDMFTAQTSNGISAVEDSSAADIPFVSSSQSNMGFSVMLDSFAIA